MTHSSRNNCNFSVTAGMYVVMALLVLILPLRWLLAAIISAALHELCHVAVIRLWGLRIYAIQIGAGGAKIHTEPMTQVQELTCALAGPAGGLALLLFARWIPMTALCGAFHSLYNLLPIYPSDGGRALRCGAKLLFRESAADSVCNIIETGFLVCVTLLGIYGSFVLNMGVFPVLIAFVLVVKKLRWKIPLQTVRSQGTIDAL